MYVVNGCCIFLSKELLNQISGSHCNALTVCNLNLVVLLVTKITKILYQVGEWTNTGGLNVTKPEAFHEFGGTNITLKVTTIEVRIRMFVI